MVFSSLPQGQPVVVKGETTRLAFSVQTDKSNPTLKKMFAPVSADTCSLKTAGGSHHFEFPKHARGGDVADPAMWLGWWSKQGSSSTHSSRSERSPLSSLSVLSGTACLGYIQTAHV